MLDWLFGSPGEMKTESALTPEQEELYNRLIQGLSGRVFTPGEQYSGPVSADPTESQQQAQTALARAISGESSLGEALQRALSGQPSTSTSPEAMDRYFSEAVEAPMRREYEETQTQLANEFAGPGTYWGGARMDAQQGAAGDFASALASERANLAWQNEQSRRQLSESAADRALQAGQLSSGLAEALYNMGSQQQNIEQQGLERLYEEFVRTRPENQPYLEAVLQALQIPAQFKYYQEGSQGAIPGLVGAGADIVSGMAAGGTGWFA